MFDSARGASGTLAVVRPVVLAVVRPVVASRLIWILTEGGPRGATTTMIIDTYKTAISRFKYGEGAARTVMIVVFLGSFMLVYFMLLSRLAKRSPHNAA